jgi:integrase/recombinase XerD
VRPSDVMAAVRSQRGVDRKVVALDGSSGLSPRTIQRRLSSVSGFFAYLLVMETPRLRSNPVPRGLPTRSERTRRSAGALLIRSPRTLPRVLSVSEVTTLRDAMRRDRDRAMIDAMVLGRLRRCEVAGLRLEDIHVGDRRVFITDGKGGRQRLVPMSNRFFVTLGAYLDHERPRDASTDRVFVAFQGRNRGEPLSLEGIDKIL